MKRIINNLRTPIATLVAALGITAATALVPSAAFAEINTYPPGQESSCDRLHDEYINAVDGAMSARDRGAMDTYQQFADAAGQVYLEAEFDYQCDWATKTAPPQVSWGALAPLNPAGSATGMSGGPSGSLTAPSSAVKSGVAYVAWLRSSNHTTVCTNLGTLSESALAAAKHTKATGDTTGAALLTQLSTTAADTAQFTHCS